MKKVVKIKSFSKLPDILSKEIKLLLKSDGYSIKFENILWYIRRNIGTKIDTRYTNDYFHHQYCMEINGYIIIAESKQLVKEFSIVCDEQFSCIYIEK